MKRKIFSSRAFGTVVVPPSKSMAHRLLIGASLANGESRLLGVSECEDVLATMDCLSTLGIDCRRDGEDVIIRGRVQSFFDNTDAVLPCRESGSTMRFLLPLALLRSSLVRLTGAPSLLGRPMKVYEELCRENGLYFEQSEQGIAVKGPLCAGVYTLPGDVSSQFISGMLFALSLCHGESILHILPPIESRSYILLTIDALSMFGASVSWTDDCTLRIVGGTPMSGKCLRVEGDYSGAAFLEAFNLFSGHVTLTGLRADSLQGDRVYRDHFQSLLRGNATISLSDCPDLAPILFSVAAACRGGTFTDTRRLRIKESDRARVMAEELRKFGTTVRVFDNSVEIEPTSFHAPTEPLSGHNDHRIVMSLSVLLSLTGGVIEGVEAVKKSYPSFFEDLTSIGIKNIEI